MDITFNLAPSYRDLKDPTSRQNFYDTPGQIPKLILTLRRIFICVFVFMYLFCVFVFCIFICVFVFDILWFIF